MSAVVTEYQRVLQEECERVCGKHLPDEIVWMILYKWGGLQTPTGGIIRNLMTMSSRNSLGQVFRVIPYGTFSQDDIGDQITEEQLDDPSAEFAIPIYNVQLVRYIDTKRYNELVSPLNPDGASQICLTAQGPLLIRAWWPPYLLIERTSPYSVWQWRGLDIWEEPLGPGMRMRPNYLWAMAAKCRGVPDRYLRFFYRHNRPPTATKSELYQLVLRAETDHTWRFWYDMILAHQDLYLPVAIGLTIGFTIRVGIVGVGARYLQSKIPGMSFPMACLGFVVTTRSLGRLAVVGCGLLTNHWLIARGPQIVRR